MRSERRSPLKIGGVPPQAGRGYDSYPYIGSTAISLPKNIVAAESTFDSNYILHFILYHYVWNLELLLGRFAVEGFIEEVAAEDFDGFGVIVCERLDVADALLLEDFFEGD